MISAIFLIVSSVFVMFFALSNYDAKKQIEEEKEYKPFKPTLGNYSDVIIPGMYYEIMGLGIVQVTAVYNELGQIDYKIDRTLYTMKLSDFKKVTNIGEKKEIVTNNDPRNDKDYQEFLKVKRELDGMK